MREYVKTCKENEPSFCSAACPFHLDVPDFMNKIQRGNFRAAYKLYQNSVAFPLVVSALCPEYCRGACPRNEIDAAVDMRRLEEAVIGLTKNLDPIDYNVPLKGKRAAVIGGGISGLSCALKLCLKKYQVVVFERDARLGGHLWELLPESIFLTDIQRQFQYEELDVRLNSEILSLPELAEENFDAVYIATGRNGRNLGIEEKEGVFIGGSILGADTIQAIAQGIEGAVAIETYFLTGKMTHEHKSFSTTIPFPDLGEILRQGSFLTGGGSAEKEQVMQEAGRCLRCSCDACKKNCDLIRYYRKSPLKMIEEVRGTTQVKGVLSDITVAIKLIASCSQCGYCVRCCPEGIDFQSYLLEARRILHKKGRMPWAFHDFFLRDMTHARENSVFLWDRRENPSWLFFPGCQLGASDPQYVLKTYQRICSHVGRVALLVDCCGAPALWSGDEEREGRMFGDFQKKWEALGQPKVIFACATCKKMMEEHIGGLKGEMVYTLLEKWRTPMKQQLNHASYAVFDPCSARHDDAGQQAVRSLSERAGAELLPIPAEKSRARCCGYGGHTAIVNSQYTKEVTQRRAAQSPVPYITYCSNCRDLLAAEGKDAVHVLDLVFSLNCQNRTAPTQTQRRQNREALKHQLQKSDDQKENSGLTADRLVKGKPIDISQALKQKLDHNYILEDDLFHVISHCERTEHKMRNQTNGHTLGSLKIGFMTYWAEYVEKETSYELINAYCHRMAFEEGEG